MSSEVLILLRLATEKEDFYSNLIPWYRAAVWAAVFILTAKHVYTLVGCNLNTLAAHMGNRVAVFSAVLEKQITKGIKFKLNRTVDLNFFNC